MPWFELRGRSRHWPLAGAGVASGSGAVRTVHSRPHRGTECRFARPRHAPRIAFKLSLHDIEGIANRGEGVLTRMATDNASDNASDGDALKK